jgi:2-methylcitrate dehydratase
MERAEGSLEGGARDSVLDDLVALARSIAYERMTEEERHGAKRVLLDALGCALGAMDSKAAEIARNIAAGAAVADGCTLIGDDRRPHGDFAAFANGVMVRYLDFNDTHASPQGVGHPSDYIPAVLAAAEEAGSSMTQVIQGIAIAYEVFARFSDAAQLGVEGWDHVLAGDLASALAAGVLWELDDHQLHHAASLSLTPNFGLQATRLGQLSMWKGCASANACRNGLFAARLAKEGLSGPPTPFVGRGGMEAVLGTEVLREALRPGDRPLAVGSSNIKHYPAGYFSQGAIELARELGSRLASHQDIAEVEIGTFAFGLRVMAGDPAKWRPATRESADHSIPYVVASALVHGDLRVEHFTPEALRDPAVARILEHLRVYEDPECAAAWPQEVMTRIRITTSSGGVEEGAIRAYRGHATNPMSDQEIEEKVTTLAAGKLSTVQLDRLFKAIWTLEEMPGVASVLKLTHHA